MRRRTAAAAAGALLATALVACGGSGPSAAPAPSASSSPPPPSTPPPPSPSSTPTPEPGSPTGAPAPGITKVLVLIVENHSLDAMRREMPWTFALAERHGYATGYRALTHPSLPNYLAIAGGDTFGVADDRSPAAHVLRGTSVFGQALAHHLAAKVYAEDMTGTCAPYDHGRYAVRHNPWTYFADEHASCARYDVPMTALDADVRSGGLPAVGMVVPDLCSDAHDCPAAGADTWMKTVVGGIMAGPDFRSGRLLVVITADEDHHDQGNLVLTTLVNPQLHGAVVRTALDHYALSRLLSEVVGAPPLRRARTAPSMVRAFGLRLGVRPAPAG